MLIVIINEVKDGAAQMTMRFESILGFSKDVKLDLEGKFGSKESMKMAFGLLVDQAYEENPDAFRV